MVKCLLCNGSGKNRSGILMRVNNDICPRCGGYGTVPEKEGTNPAFLTFQDQAYCANNGIASVWKCLEWTKRSLKGKS